MSRLCSRMVAVIPAPSARQTIRQMRPGQTCIWHFRWVDSVHDHLKTPDMLLFGDAGRILRDNLTDAFPLEITATGLVPSKRPLCPYASALFMALRTSLFRRPSQLQAELRGVEEGQTLGASDLCVDLSKCELLGLAELIRSPSRLKALISF